MARPRRFDVPGAIYHVTARGDGQRAVFHAPGEMAAYICLLGDVGAKAGWTLLAYCLMTNHVHLLVRRGEVSLGRAMNWLQGKFVRRANRRAMRTGRRFGDRYRAWFVRDERHALAASCYIHRNPVTAGIVGQAEAYGWSSLWAYLGGPRLGGVRPDEVLEWAGGSAAYAERVALPPPEPPVARWKGIPVLGEPGPALLAAAVERRVERLRRAVAWPDVVRAVARLTGGRSDGQGHEAARCRAVILATGAAFGLPLRGAATLLGYSAGAVSPIVARTRRRARRDAAWAYLLRAARDEATREITSTVDLRLVA